MDRVFIFFQYIMPQHWLSRLVGKLASTRITWLKNMFIKRFIAAYQVNMQEAVYETADDFDCFNSFFTRELKPGLRPLPTSDAAIVSPADGAISALGQIHADSIFQAKNKDFSLCALLGGNEELAKSFHDGSFATVYLSPKDYHRVHMPLGGTLETMIYIPGDLFSVNQTTANNIDGLFARNERAVCLFATEHGPMAVILVGAMIVAGIETVWAGQVAPAGKAIVTTQYQAQNQTTYLDRGDEVGRFKLGSTAIVLFPKGVMQWSSLLTSGSDVRMGQEMGTLVSKAKS